MNFGAFWAALQALELGIAITTPLTAQVRRAYWGAPPEQMSDLPAVINTMTETDRVLGMGRRRESQYRISVQLLAARATTDDARNAWVATEFWFAAKRRFDDNPTLDGQVTMAILQGAVPTVPVLLQHGGQGYIGFDGVLEVHVVEVAP